MAKGKLVTIYSNSRYTFSIAHVHSAIYKDRGLLTSAGKDIKKIRDPRPTISHLATQGCGISTLKEHQKEDSLEATGNQAADEAAWEATLKPVRPPQILITLPNPDLPTLLTYSEKEQKLVTQK